MSSKRPRESSPASSLRDGDDDEDIGSLGSEDDSQFDDSSDDEDDAELSPSSSEEESDGDRRRKGGKVKGKGKEKDDLREELEDEQEIRKMGEEVADYDNFDHMLDVLGSSSADPALAARMAETDDISRGMASIREELALTTNFGKARKRMRARSGAIRERRYPQDIIELLGSGNAAFALSELPEAEGYMREVIKIDASIPEAWMMMASISEEMGDKEKEIAYWFIAAHLKQDAETWRDIATKSREKGMWDQAGYCMKRAVKIGKDQPGLVFAQAELLRDWYFDPVVGGVHRIGEQAAEGFEKLLKIGKNKLDILFLSNIHALYIHLNRISQLIDIFQTAFTYHMTVFESPESDSTVDIMNIMNMDLIVSLTDLYIMDHGYEDAIEVAKKGQRWLDGRSKEEFWNGMDDDREYDPVGVRRREKDQSKRGRNGEVTRAGDEEESEGEAAGAEVEGMGGYELDVNLRARLAISRLKLGNDVEAEIHTKEILSTDVAFYHDLWIQIGDALIERGKYEKSYALFHRVWEAIKEHFDAVSEQPPDAEPPEPSPFDDQEFYTSVVRKTGISALYAGKTGEAEDAFDEVLRNAPDDLETMLKMAEAYEQQGYLEKAMQMIGDVRRRRTEQAIDAGDALQEEKDESEEEETGGLFPNARKPRRGRPPKNYNEMSAASREVQEEQEAKNNYRSLKELEEEMESENHEIAIEARRNYSEIAKGMVRQFRMAKGLFPVDKSRKFFKYGEGPKLANKSQQTLETRAGYIMARIQNAADATRDAPNQNQEVVRLVAIQKIEFQGLHADIWLEIVVKYCCFMMQEGEEEEVNDVLSHVQWSNIFEPLKYYLALSLAMLAAAKRSNNSPRVYEICRSLIYRFQFRGEAWEFLSAAGAPGIETQEAFGNLNLQKFLLREIKIWDAAAMNKDCVWNESLGKWVWRRDGRPSRYRKKVKKPPVGQGKGKGKPQQVGNKKRKGKEPAMDMEGEGEGSEDISSDEDEEDDDQEHDGGGGGGDVDEAGTTTTGTGIRFERRAPIPTPTSLSPISYTTYGEMMMGTKSFQGAIYYFLKAYEFNPYDPLLCLLLAQAYCGRSMQRQSDNRLHQITTGVAFLNRYRRLMADQAESDIQLDEVEFNFGRVFHGLGILHLAVKHYQTVLSQIATRMRQSDSPETVLIRSIARDTAYNLCLVFQMTGSSLLVKAVTEQWLTV